MKTIKLLSLNLRYFKGIRSLDASFGDAVTTISGMNGTGKTTVFDAFTWLLFGKDSHGRKSFNIKTLNEKGEAIERVTHEVSGILEVNGEKISLRRTYSEKWTKKRGSAEEVFTGHEEERYYNEVPVSVKEWAEKIDGICPEEQFKFLTNPLYFNEQKKEVKRAMLMDIAGDVTDEDIAATDTRFAELIHTLSGKTLDEYRKELAAKKKRIKAEIDEIPARIDERKRGMVEINFDVAGIDEELARLEAELAAAQNALTNQYEAYKLADTNRQRMVKELAELQAKKMKLETAESSKAYAEYQRKLAEKRELTGSVERKKSHITEIEAKLQRDNEFLAKCRKQREDFIAEWREIKKRTITFDADDFVCPTCKRPLDPEDMQAKQEELTKNFNLQKAADLEENTKKGQNLARTISVMEDEIKSYEATILAINAELAELEKSELLSVELVAPTPMASEIKSEEYESLITRIAEVEKELSKPQQLPDDSDLREKVSEIQLKIRELDANKQLSEAAEKQKSRIDELQKQMKELNTSLAELEGQEFVVEDFTHTKNAAVEDRVNELFSFVKFRMFEKQINGGELETCEATVNGVPYSDLNSAMKINAGIDIINTISRHMGISCPMFIDNSESVNQVEETDAQLIKLAVTTEPNLCFKLF